MTILIPLAPFLFLSTAFYNEKAYEESPPLFSFANHPSKAPSNISILATIPDPSHV